MAAASAPHSPKDAEHTSHDNFLRAVGVAVGVSLALLSALFVVVLALHQASAGQGNDLIPLVAASHLLTTNTPEALYHTAALGAREHALLPHFTVTSLAYEDPPFLALVSIPLTAIPLAVLLPLWSFVQALLLAAAVALAVHQRERRAAMAVAAITVSLPLELVLLTGQIDGLVACGYVGAWWLSQRQRWGWSGFLIAVLIGATKPELLLPLAAYLLITSRGRVIPGACLGALLTLGVPTLLYGAGIWHAYIGALTHGQAIKPLWTYASSISLGSNVLHPPLTAIVEALILVIGTLAGALLGWHHRMVSGRNAQVSSLSRGASLSATTRLHPLTLEAPLTLAALIALGLAVSPHLLSYDIALLAPPLAALTIDAHTVRWLVFWEIMCAGAALNFVADVLNHPYPPLVALALTAFALWSTMTVTRDHTPATVRSVVV